MFQVVYSPKSLELVRIFVAWTESFRDWEENINLEHLLL